MKKERNSGSSKMNEMNPTTCAVCRHQRKMCEENCVFTRHFPLERSGDFHKVQKLFGIQNVKKVLSCVEENQIDKTLETIILEARIRDEHPVYGPLEIEKTLSAQIHDAEKQLDVVRKMIEFFRGGHGHGKTS